ncbi:hypothetical protein SAMN05421766_103463 [Zobellia uliginosa]|uniref:Uncharacterized protein n=1 Tax=Zobellia uliginosa TaxID=143224 RepID=A0ABY1KRT2_9FLAO|nr:hypothetical protein SAMN05421766_103463 [Zobellia uliginosa]
MRNEKGGADLYTYKQPPPFTNNQWVYAMLAAMERDNGVVCLPSKSDS